MKLILEWSSMVKLLWYLLKVQLLWLRSRMGTMAPNESTCICIIYNKAVNNSCFRPYFCVQKFKVEGEGAKVEKLDRHRSWGSIIHEESTLSHGDTAGSVPPSLCFVFPLLSLSFSTPLSLWTLFFPISLGREWRCYLHKREKRQGYERERRGKVIREREERTKEGERKGERRESRESWGRRRETRPL